LVKSEFDVDVQMALVIYQAFFVNTYIVHIRFSTALAVLFGQTQLRLVTSVRLLVEIEKNE